MKILNLISFYVPAYNTGGPVVSVHNLNKWLAKKGIEVTVYTTNLAGKETLDVPLNKPINIDGVTVWYFPCSLLRKWEYSKLLHKTLKKTVSNFDLIHIGGSLFRATSLFGAYYARKFKKPYIVSPRGNLMQEPLKKKSSLKKKIYLSLIERRNLAAASVIHFTVEAEKEEYLKAGLPFRKTVVIPNGLDPEEFSRRPPLGFFRKKFGIGENKKIVLFMGRLSWKKGLDTLIPAFAEVIKKEPKVILVLAGPDDDGYQKEVLKFINEVNLRTSDVQKLKALIFGTSDVQNIENPGIIFTGMLVGEDKTAAFQESDVFALPSYSENFGMAVIEAMYFGLPVVITKNVGISPSVKKNQAGLVVEKDEKQLAEAILKILNNSDLAKEMGEKGKQLVEIEFSWPEIVDKFIKEYNNLITNSQ